jgi:hypothetical protein
MQPLDVSFMLPLRTYYAQKIESWVRMNPTRVGNIHAEFNKEWFRHSKVIRGIHRHTDRKEIA